MIYGLTTAFAWGFANFFSKGYATRHGVFATLAGTQIGCLCLILAWSLISGHPPLSTITVPVLPALAAATLTNAAALIALIAAFRFGRASLAAPLCGCYAVVATGLALLTGTDSSSWAVIGVLSLAFAGTVIVLSCGARSSDSAYDDRMAAKLALFSAAAGGSSIWIADAHVLPRMGTLDLLLADSIILGAIALIVAGRLGKVMPRDISGWMTLILIVTLTLTGGASYMYGLTSSAVGLVSVISSASAAVTAFAGIAALKERPRAPQLFGGILILSAIPLLAFTTG